MKHGKEKENTNCAGEEQSQDAEQSQRQKLLGYTKAEGKNFRFEDFVVLLLCHGAISHLCQRQVFRLRGGRTPRHVGISNKLVPIVVKGDRARVNGTIVSVSNKSWFLKKLFK